DLLIFKPGEEYVVFEGFPHEALMIPFLQWLRVREEDEMPPVIDPDGSKPVSDLCRDIFLPLSITLKDLSKDEFLSRTKDELLAMCAPGHAAVLMLIFHKRLHERDPSPQEMTAL